MITTINISFNHGLKQYQYLLEGEKNNLNVGKSYKVIKGTTSRGIIYDTITIHKIENKDYFPNIITAGLKLKSPKIVQLYKLPSEQLDRLRLINRPAVVSNNGDAPVVEEKILTNRFWEIPITSVQIYLLFCNNFDTYDYTTRSLHDDLQSWLKHTNILINILNQNHCSVIRYIRDISIKELQETKDKIMKLIEEDK